MVKRFWACGFTAALILQVVTTFAYERPRIASTTLCADQFVIALADRGQIVSVSHEADSPLSYYASHAKDLNRNRASAAELLKQDAQIIVMDERGDPQLAHVMERFGVDVIRIPLSSSFEDIENTTLEIARKFGQDRRGQAIVDDLQKRRAALEKKSQRTRRPIALYFRPDGGGAADRTFVNTALALAGFDNLQVLKGQVGWIGFPLELAIQSPPDVIVTSFFDRMYQSVSAGFSRHRVFVSLAEKRPVIAVPGSLWICANPLLMNAAEFLMRERERLYPGEIQESSDGREGEKL